MNPRKTSPAKSGATPEELPKVIRLVPSPCSYKQFVETTARALGLPEGTKLPSKPNSRLLSLACRES